MLSRFFSLFRRIIPLLELNFLQKVNFVKSLEKEATKCYEKVKEYLIDSEMKTFLEVAQKIKYLKLKCLKDN